MSRRRVAWLMFSQPFDVTGASKHALTRGIYVNIFVLYTAFMTFSDSWRLWWCVYTFIANSSKPLKTRGLLMILARISKTHLIVYCYMISAFSVANSYVICYRLSVCGENERNEALAGEWKVAGPPAPRPRPRPLFRSSLLTESLAHANFYDMRSKNVLDWIYEFYDPLRTAIQLNSHGYVIVPWQNEEAHKSGKNPWRKHVWHDCVAIPIPGKNLQIEKHIVGIISYQVTLRGTVPDTSQTNRVRQHTQT